MVTRAIIRCESITFGMEVMRVLAQSALATLARRPPPTNGASRPPCPGHCMLSKLEADDDDVDKSKANHKMDIH